MRGANTDLGKLSPQASGVVVVVGAVFVMTGIGNIVGGGHGITVGLVFGVLGVGLVAFGLIAQRRWFAAADVPPPPMLRQLLGVISAIAAGTAVYVLVTFFSDRF